MIAALAQVVTQIALLSLRTPILLVISQCSHYCVRGYVKHPLYLFLLPYLQTRYTSTSNNSVRKYINHTWMN